MWDSNKKLYSFKARNMLYITDLFSAQMIDEEFHIFENANEYIITLNLSILNILCITLYTFPNSSAWLILNFREPWTLNWIC